MIFYRLVLTNGFILLLTEVFQALVLNRCLNRSPNIDAEKFFVNIIDTQVIEISLFKIYHFFQALVWLGSIVAPLLPLLGIVSNVVNFYIKSWLALNVYEPPNITCSASRNSILQYNLTLMTLLFCALPVTTFIYGKRDFCGPNSGQAMSSALSNRLHRIPAAMKTIIRWMTNPIILGGALLVVTFFFLLERVHKRKWKRVANRITSEFNAFRFISPSTAFCIDSRHGMKLKLEESRRKNSPQPIPSKMSYTNHCS